MISTKYFYIADMVQMPVLIAHYGESPYKTYLYGEFLNLYGDGQKNSIFTPESLHRGFVKVGYGPKCARASFKTLTSVQYNNNIIAFLTTGLRKKSSIYKQLTKIWREIFTRII